MRKTFSEYVPHVSRISTAGRAVKDLKVTRDSSITEGEQNQ